MTLGKVRDKQVKHKQKFKARDATEVESKAVAQVKVIEVKVLEAIINVQLRMCY